ncbi:MAG: PaaI family thioesterase [Burkholderiales bacterium]|nr:PaaI family thioesterase [Burkholderiales bacterium]
MNTMPSTMLNVDTLQHMNLKVLHASDNVLKVEMPPVGNSNHLGGVYAGAIFSLAEFPFGMLCVNRFGMEEFVPVVGEVTIRYLAPATGTLTVEVNVSDEEWAQIVQETRSKGKCKIVKDIEIKDAQGKVNTIAKATYFTVMRPK